MLLIIIIIFVNNHKQALPTSMPGRCLCPGGTRPLRWGSRWCPGWAGGSPAAGTRAWRPPPGGCRGRGPAWPAPPACSCSTNPYWGQTELSLSRIIQKLEFQGLAGSGGSFTKLSSFIFEAWSKMFWRIACMCMCTCTDETGRTGHRTWQSGSYY